MDVGGQPTLYEGANLILPDPPHDEDRLRDPGAPQLQAFLDDGDGEAGRALLREAPGDVHRAVPVRVGLDDREHAASPGQAGPEYAVVRRHRVEVDDGPGRPERGRHRPGPSLIIARSEKRVYSPDHPSVKRSVGPFRCFAMMTSQTFFCSVSLS